MDPLSDVLSRIKPRSYAFRGLDAAGDWAIVFEAFEGIKCYAVHSGSCWLTLDGGRSPTRLEAGDLVLVSGRHSVRLFSTPEAPDTKAAELFPNVPLGSKIVLNGGDGCTGIGGFFAFEAPYSALLQDLLPPIIHVPAQSTRTALANSINYLMCELRDPQLGSELIAAHLAQTLLIEALRLRLLDAPSHARGWLFALGDRRLRPAISAMHRDPARAWTLAGLASIAGMSRSSFADRFKTLAGEPAMAYLTRWRMLLAVEKLAQDRAPLSIVAPAVGYRSESAFGAAFKRVTGQSPRHFTRAE